MPVMFLVVKMTPLSWMSRESDLNPILLPIYSTLDGTVELSQHECIANNAIL